MKKYIVGLLVIIIICMTAFIGCAEKKQCSLCGETKYGENKTVMGEKVFICNDCAKEINSLFK